MSRTIMLIPIDANINLTNISLGVMRCIEKKNISLKFFKPIAESLINNDNAKKNNTIIYIDPSILIAKPLCMFSIEMLLNSYKQDLLMEEIAIYYNQNIKDTEIILIEGLIPYNHQQLINNLNYTIANTLNAEIVFVMTLGNYTTSQIKTYIEIACSTKFNSNKNITGVIMNTFNTYINEQDYIRSNLFKISNNITVSNSLKSMHTTELIENIPIPILGFICWNIKLFATRAIDIVNHLKARIINEGDIKTRRINSVIICTRSTLNILKDFRPGSLLVTSADRLDIIIAACLAVMNGVTIGGILLTNGSYNIDKILLKICKCAFNTGLPVFIVDKNTWQTSMKLQQCFNLTVPTDDYQRIEKLRNYVASHIDSKWIDSLTINHKSLSYLSPHKFRYQLVNMARKSYKRIVLPEGNEPRIIKAVTICAERNIAKCILLGSPKEIHRVASDQGIILNKNIDIVNPNIIREHYITHLMKLRNNKGITECIARQQLEDNVVLGTMMLEQNEVDGLVSGVVHTTANTIRPSLQLIKTAPNSVLVSSVFFMLFPDKVLVYGDCALNINPTAEQLSEIAIQSADSAAIFGIKPRVAMLSYSTGYSGLGSEVDKVRKATHLAKKKRPDLIIDGPLQYDAAIIKEIAELKAPNSPIAGTATVLIFPDLNTGNITYKAVQRSANIISIGPMLQGMRKPVNDLSRGALVDDIVYTVAITAIQAAQADYLE
ncbi:Phosphate acetyltransferase [Candidatus Profftia lariciata]|nr:Phosphate acetyltransferase [Candidatus Profftia lariciata]